MPRFSPAGGGDWGGKAWTSDLPDDSQLLLYILCAFLQNPGWDFGCVPSSLLSASAAAADPGLAAGGMPPAADISAAALGAGGPFYVAAVPQRAPDRYSCVLVAPAKPSEKARRGHNTQEHRAFPVLHSRFFFRSRVGVLCPTNCASPPFSLLCLFISSNLGADSGTATTYPLPPPPPPGLPSPPTAAEPRHRPHALARYPAPLPSVRRGPPAVLHAGAERCARELGRWESWKQGNQERKLLCVCVCVCDQPSCRRDA